MKIITEKSRMLYIIAAAALLLFACVLSGGALGAGRDINVLIYMCAADLETQGGAATADIDEMLLADIPSNVHVYIETGGTLAWQGHGISPEHTQIYSVRDGQLLLIDDTLPQLDMTSPDTLSSFVSRCTRLTPARRNMLIFWGHGSGPVYGFGYDEYAGEDAALTLPEIQTALDEAGAKFETVGFDACLMGALETAYALQGRADYLLASEDFENGCGWDYTSLLNAIAADADAKAVANIAAECFVRQSAAANAEGVLAFIDISEVKNTYEAWKNFAYTQPRASLIPRVTEARKNAKYAFGENMVTCGMADLLSAARQSTAPEAAALIKAAQKSIVLCKATQSSQNLSGLSVTLPFLSSDFFKKQSEIYKALGFDAEYISLLGSFAPNATA